MEPKYQLTDSNEYTPSKQASAAVTRAQSHNAYTPDKPDVYDKSEAGNDQPKNPAGGSVPKESEQQGSDVVGSATGDVTRKPIEKN